VRIAVALYDRRPTTSRPSSTARARAPLKHYSIKLASAGWLDALRRTRRPRVIDALEPPVPGSQPHSVLIGAANYKASYTVRSSTSSFLGFVFFNTDQSHVFTERVTRQLDLFVRIISLMVESTLRSVDILVGGLHLLREISRFRDDETSSHLSRMSYYSELIARQIAAEIGREDDWVEHVRLFAPLHDIGKIATPDTILFAGQADQPSPR
jgi:HD-GYP domain-containing protein (c-di-GMP phosphodiesterase class II)